MLNTSKFENILFRIRFPLLLVGIIALLTGIISGLQRMGWSISFPAIYVLSHGPLMVSGFLGTVIGMERAVALNKPWGYLAPLGAFLGVIAMLVDPLSTLGSSFMIFSSVVLTLILLSFLKRDFQLHFFIMAIAPLFWLTGNLLWINLLPFSHVAIWWAGFLVFTIAGERLELSRITRLTPGKRNGFIVISVITFLGMTHSMLNFDLGIRVFSPAWGCWAFASGCCATT